jgi:hypothetical protein
MKFLDLSFGRLSALGYAPGYRVQPPRFRVPGQGGRVSLSTLEPIPSSRVLGLAKMTIGELPYVRFDRYW